MQHFLVEITYTAPAEVIAGIVDAHRAFLQTGYEKGRLLLSGPLSTRTGGVVIARAPSEEDLRAFFANDPYHLNGAAEYRFASFNPVKRQAFMEDWLTHPDGMEK